MKICPNCHAETNDEALYCPVCGTGLDSYIHPRPQQPYEEIPVYAPPIPEADPFDHTEEFCSDDIANTKLVCMCVYLLDFIGIIIGLLAARESEYTAFHIKQSLKFTVLEALLVLAAGLFCWTFIVPIVAGIALMVLMVLRFVSFTQVCSGKAKEPILIRSISFLK